jgi:hypothetical protein
MLRGVLDDMFRQLSGRKELDPMSGEGACSVCANTDGGKNDR